MNWCEKSFFRSSAFICGVSRWIFLFFILSHYGFAIQSSNLVANNRYIIVHSTRLGLANRLRVIADWYHLADLSNRHLLLSWVPSPDCNIDFFDLFVDGPKRFTVLSPPLPFGPKGLEEVKEMARESNLTFSSILTFSPFDFAVHPDFFFDTPERFLLFDNNIDVLFTTFDGPIVLPEMPCHSHLIMRSIFYSSLIPNPEVQKIVQDVREKYFVNRLMIGIHVRTHNSLYDWEISPPAPGETRATAFGEKTKLEHFIIQMKALEGNFQKKQSQFPDLKPTHRFFITSNDDETKRALGETFSDAVTLRSHLSTSRDSREGMIFALIEWLLLSKCHLIINSFGSSFASEASLIHRVPIIGLWNTAAVYTLDHTLPYCGHMQYCKYQSTQAEDWIYEEGTVDKRKVTGKLLSFIPCPLLTEWGLINLYCMWHED